MALAGTAASVLWFPDHVASVVLALDADDGGQGVTPRLAERLEQAGFTVACCTPPGDGWGKDWSERWRRKGEAGIRPLAEVCARLGPGPR
jgi:DNA primase